MLPFLKWAGGKRWLFTQAFVESLPEFERYIEPFLGAGAGFFALQPERALISDVNSDLIELYQVMRDHPADLKRKLEEHQKFHTKAYYYDVRSSKPRGRISRAARMLYLNRTCWNGLYRLNRLGEFNVPIGTKTTVILPNDDFRATAKSLASAELVSCDFETTIGRAVRGDLVFVDPPYTVKHDMNGFVKYNETIFKWSDQVRLRDSLLAAVTRGASIIVTNANHHSVKELYQGFGKHLEVSRQSIISGKANGRSDVSELMVRA